MPRNDKITLPDIELAEKLDTSNLRQYTEVEILRLLASLPKTKYVYGAEVIEKGRILDEKKFELKRATAVAHIEANTYKDDLKLSSADDRKAYAMNDKRVVEAETEVVKASGDYEFAKLQFGYADDLFIAVRKAATIVEKQLEAQKQADQYTRYENIE